MGGITVDSDVDVCDLTTDAVPTTGVVGCVVTATICVNGVSVLLPFDGVVVNPVATDNELCVETADVVKDVIFFNRVALNFVAKAAFCVSTDCIIRDGVVIDSVTIGALISAGTVV